VLANTKFCVHKTNFPPTWPFIQTTNNTIINHRHRVHRHRHTILPTRYQHRRLKWAPTRTDADAAPIRQYTCYGTTHRRRLESATKPLPPALSLKQQSHRRRIAVVIIIEARYRRSICIVVSSIVVGVLSSSWCGRYSTATSPLMQQSNPRCRSPSRRCIMAVSSSSYLEPNATIKSSLSLPCLRRGVIVVSLLMYRRRHDAEPAYPCNLTTDATIKSSSPRRQSKIMVASIDVVSLLSWSGARILQSNPPCRVSTLSFMTYVNLVYESSCSLFNMETICPMQ